MPNWVYNELTVTGDLDLTKELRYVLNQPFPVLERQGYGAEAVAERQMAVDPVFSFMNIINPYTHGVDFDEYNSVNGYSGGEHTGQTPGNWYNWNNLNWGVKWDASQPRLTVNKDSIVYDFETAWGAPYPVIAELSIQFPELDFVLKWTEEQGFGSIITFKNGVADEVESWDYPASHAEQMEHLGYCCDDEFDEDKPYADCPRAIDFDPSI